MDQDYNNRFYTKFNRIFFISKQKDGMVAEVGVGKEMFGGGIYVGGR